MLNENFRIEFNSAKMEQHLITIKSMGRRLGLLFLIILLREMEQTINVIKAKNFYVA